MSCPQAFLGIFIFFSLDIFKVENTDMYSACWSSLQSFLKIKHFSLSVFLKLKPRNVFVSVFSSLSKGVTSEHPALFSLFSDPWILKFPLSRQPIVHEKVLTQLKITLFQITMFLDENPECAIILTAIWRKGEESGSPSYLQLGNLTRGRGSLSTRRRVGNVITPKNNDNLYILEHLHS